ncbi:MAG: MupG family TIM beta-alpha barrel fold protein, partial [Atopostipes sp.]|nr:MupG family TIM beta-alpha barrel fold protein [Atopostipes sp.]
MKELGVSIYPSKSNLKEDKAYLKLASKYGFTRVFTSLLEISGD